MEREPINGEMRGSKRSPGSEEVWRVGKASPALDVALRQVETTHLRTLWTNRKTQGRARHQATGPQMLAHSLHRI